MKKNKPSTLLLIACFSVFLLFGCDGSGGNDSETTNTGSSSGTSTGTAVLRGTITSFETANGTRIQFEKSRFAVGTFVRNILLPQAQAAGNREGIVVYIDGPVSKSTTTASNGSFEFTELPPGTYGLRFEYNGEEVRYRGNSGQVATITLEGDTITELLSIRIDGGKANIGNIKIYGIPKDNSDSD